MKHITRAIWILSIISLLSDIASEMLYPIIPLYLKTIGFSAIYIGVLEGVAEATAGFSNGYFGKLSDVSGKRVPFVRIGYLLTTLSKPIIGIFKDPLMIIIARATDRLGKGIRTGARDAMLSDETSAAHKGRVFGFHRSMDTAGAVIGLLLAYTYMFFAPGDYQTLFMLAFIPGIFSVVLTLFIKEKPKEKQEFISHDSAWQFITYWKHSSTEYKRIVIGLLLFTLFNGSDFFLLLKMKQDGLTDTTIIGIYIFYNLVYASLALPLGIIADKIGLKAMLMLGLSSYAALYFGMAFNTSASPFLVLFFLYGFYSAATEGISKAWISNTSHKHDIATALGTFQGLQSVGLLIASLLTGVLWTFYGAEITFIIVGSITLFVAFYFFMMKPPKSKDGIQEETTPHNL